MNFFLSNGRKIEKTTRIHRKWKKAISYFLRKKQKKERKKQRKKNNFEKKEEKKSGRLKKME